MTDKDHTACGCGTQKHEDSCGCATHTHDEGCGCGSEHGHHHEHGEAIGTFAVETARCGSLGHPEWVGMHVTGPEGEAVLVMPTLKAVAIASSYLATAQIEGMQLPREKVQEALEGQMEKPTAAPIIAAGLKVSDNGEELHINVGFGVMRFVLTGAAREEAKKKL